MMINDIVPIETALFAATFITTGFALATRNTKRQLWLLNLALVPLWCSVVMRGATWGIIAISALMVVAFLGTLAASKHGPPE